MIIVNILGGLGNQMFQYACARSLAEDHNDELYLDISGFKRYNLWPYKLNRFRLSRCRYLNN